MDLVKELWAFLKVRKKFWLIPVFIIMSLIGMLLILSLSSSAVAPLIYTIF